MIEIVTVEKPDNDDGSLIEYIHTNKYRKPVEDDELEDSDLFYAILNVEVFVPMERGVKTREIKRRVISSVPADTSFGPTGHLSRISDDLIEPLSPLRQGATVIPKQNGQPVITITVDIGDEMLVTNRNYAVLGSYLPGYNGCPTITAEEGPSCQRSGRFHSVNDNDDGIHYQATLFVDPNSQGEGQ